MLRLAISLVLFALARTEDLLGVNYSFDIDFYTNFNSKRCDNENMWRLVTYGGLDIEPPYTDSGTAIQAIGESCTSSFPIIFVGGTLEIIVYSQEISQFLNLRIEVIDDDGIFVTSYNHRSKKDFRPGWQTISLTVYKHVKGYIHFRGRSLKNELLLIDSFRYTPNSTITYEDKRAKRSVDLENEDEQEIIFNYKAYKNEYENEQFESSGDNEYETEQPPPTTEEPIVEPQESSTFWNPFTISLVSFGVVVVVTMFVVGAYHYGKVRAVDNTPLSLIDVEPPRTITIPRVTGRSNRINQLRSYD